MLKYVLLYLVLLGLILYLWYLRGSDFAAEQNVGQEAAKTAEEAPPPATFQLEAPKTLRNRTLPDMPKGDNDGDKEQ